ncbi:hypothetical protein CHGG_06180 [Chaetomium globosum CBS 148.51]|uniref:BPL/LPL catalytic domain-containing protein n=1 Tax=Chaetomium globosum (strain ATCC 6205 / CBS 148.51 / DSM 1962 / NBRC 6347 / NRRL 1970) TaxID=306901 RepID=Q2H585_CHAGB|nr:uncharacterized protein CHGG_06180 [Chaetomium globosum CBS 148.51]EAQ89561.1 hypothetical protein CHGG_06180 [Chaetomium globosum CBS 148.51]
MAPLRLRHLHLPSIHPHYIPYRLADRVQQHLRRQHLDFKDGSAVRPPPPTLISFTPSPIYTLGRRQITPLTSPEAARLTAPLQIPIPSPLPWRKNKTTPPNTDTTTTTTTLHPQILHSPRGGLTTYHGPGQAVLWPVLDLRSPHHRHFSVKCYARLLETTTMATLRRVFGVAGVHDGTIPGVWVEKGGGSGSNPWARFVACGLAGQGVTSLAREVVAAVGGDGLAGVDERLLGLAGGGYGSREGAVAHAWAGVLAEGIGLGEGGVEAFGG